MRGEHYSIELGTEDEQGWVLARCACGAALGVFPSDEDACDALMDHAYEAGRADAVAASSEEAQQT